MVDKAVTPYQNFLYTSYVDHRDHTESNMIELHFRLLEIGIDDIRHPFTVPSPIPYSSHLKPPHTFLDSPALALIGPYYHNFSISYQSFPNTPYVDDKDQTVSLMIELGKMHLD